MADGRPRAGVQKPRCGSDRQRCFRDVCRQNNFAALRGPKDGVLVSGRQITIELHERQIPIIG